MKNKVLLFVTLALLLIPFALATDTGDAIISIGALFFVVLLAISFIVGGIFSVKYSFDNKYLKWIGILLILSGLIFFYSASGMASIYIQNISNALGGESQIVGIFVFLARIIKYSPYVISLAMAFFAVKFFTELKKKRANSDAWDNGQY